ncbi:dienelactone hydrolase [Saccharopolyspora erythraea NRRL 2338]|uniref:Dienelactone hydrolase n=2 Tax=Saccharopolyspora erythraea TaxID=1836 RepID=A4FN55_SACEN|nr:alpha/beta fold hydrolase [Saccharopolyspora erythraea]EQD84440.1 DeoR family transcriptional regulator [Saccharopolyspora erythraea D]PFG99121.1 dienelactone hydrolase [Saccharopolyspora erythraea NRRL 2338]QRK89079.1 alpha/beta fold hydrolase [Saccharopolyspora erythraea]CAM05480.1 dienelactone hydrolase [Saccharopolyspora erythraea NRRL 2338]
MAHLTAEPVEMRVATGTLNGDLVVPPAAEAVVLFAHGSGSSRHSPRNRAVAEALQNTGFATMLLDLLTTDEANTDDRTQALRFDIDLLTDRVVTAVDWLEQRQATRGMPVGLFGASTGAAAALKGASRRPGRVAAVVSRGGRPDLSGEALSSVQAPTLLIVGGDDREVLELNRHAAKLLTSLPLTDVQIEIVQHAGHLFEEPGALEKVSDLAAGWFRRYLGVPRPEGPTGTHVKPPEPVRRGVNR